MTNGNQIAHKFVSHSIVIGCLAFFEIWGKVHSNTHLIQKTYPYRFVFL